jgi:hypothetical protein
MIVKKSTLEEAISKNKKNEKKLKKEIEKLEADLLISKDKNNSLENKNDLLNIEFKKRDDFFNSIGLSSDKYFNKNVDNDLWVNRSKLLLNFYISEKIKKFHKFNISDDLELYSHLPYYDKDKINEYLNNKIEDKNYSEINGFFEHLGYLKMYNFLISDKSKSGF